MANQPSHSPPAGSRLMVELRDNGLTITAPRQPARKAAKGVFRFAIAWNSLLLFCAAIGVAAAFDQASQSYRPGPDANAGVDLPSLVILAVFTLLFGGVGVASIVAVFYARSRRAIIDVVGDHLVITRASMFGSRQDEWLAEDLDCIHRAATGSTVNDKSIDCMRVDAKDGRKQQFFSNLPDEDIDYIISVLRPALNMPTPEWEKDTERDRHYGRGYVNPYTGRPSPR